MDTIILLFLSLLTAFVGKCISKLSSKKVVYNKSDGYVFFLLVNSLVACVFFFFASGFAIEFDYIITFFAIIYSLVVLISLVSNLKLLQQMQISNATVITSSCSLITNVLLGFVLFGENLNFIKILRLVLMISACIIISLRKCGKKSKNKVGFSLPLLGVIISGVMSFIVLKYFTQFSKSQDNNSFFFLTNVILFVEVLVWFFIQHRDEKFKFSDYKPFFRILNIFIFSSNTVLSNISSVLSLLLIAKMEPSVYTSISSAFGILSGVASSLVFREKINKQSFIAAVVAIIAVII